MVLQFHSIEDKKKYERKANISIIVWAVILAIIPIFLSAFQIVRGVVSIWNIMPTVMVIVIVVINIASNSKDKNADGDRGLFYKQNIEGVTEPPEEERESSLLSIIKPLSLGEKLLRILVAAILIGMGIFVVTIPTNFAKENPNCVTVNATILDQEDRTTYEVSYDSDGDRTVTEHRACWIKFTYTLDGIDYQKEQVVQNISFVTEETFEIYVNSSGDFVRTTFSVSRYYILGPFLMFIGVLFLLSMYFSITNMIYISIPFIFIPVVVLVFLGTDFSFKENLYNDLFAFLSLFFAVGLYFFASLFSCCLSLPKDLSSVATFVKKTKKVKNNNSLNPTGKTVRSNKSGSHQVVIGRVSEDMESDDFHELDSEDELQQQNTSYQNSGYQNNFNNNDNSDNLN